MNMSIFPFGFGTLVIFVLKMPLCFFTIGVVDVKWFDLDNVLSFFILKFWGIERMKDLVRLGLDSVFKFSANFFWWFSVPIVGFFGLGWFLSFVNKGKVYLSFGDGSVPTIFVLLLKIS